MLAPAVAQHVIETLRDAGASLVGDDAHEIARVEACIPAFTPDLEPGLTPAEADLDVLLDIPRGEAARILAGVMLEADAGVPAGTPVNIGAPAGEMRSCLRSPGLNATIGLALLDARRALPGAAIDAAGIPGTIVSKPFYRRRS
jgi:glycine cleavage system aminomethyltransferase T